MVGYPPCPKLEAFDGFLGEKYGLDVVVGAHPIPEGYYQKHQKLGTRTSLCWQELMQHVVTDEEMRRAYD